MLKLRYVAGHSLEPLLPEGKVIVTTKARKLRQGDIVVAAAEGTRVIKIVGEIKNDKACLQGTSRGHDVGWVNISDISERLFLPRISDTLEYTKA